jgi:hypothetical protein
MPRGIFPARFAASRHSVRHFVGSESAAVI